MASPTSSSYLLLLPAFLLVLLFFFVSLPTTENHVTQFFSTFIPLKEDNMDYPSRNLPQLSSIESPLASTNTSKSVKYASASLLEESPLATTNISKSAKDAINNNTSSILQGAIIKKNSTIQETTSNTSSVRFVSRGVSLRQEKSSLEKVEEDLARARAAISKAVKTRKYSLDKNESFVPRGSIYRNPYAFHQSHKEMVNTFKVWPYKEGQPPLAHDGPLNDIYAIEGQFMDEIESQKSKFRASRPDEAHAFYLPFSVANVIHFVYRPILKQTEFSRDRLQRIVKDYIIVVADKYPFWNRSNGADHFMVSCHDWAPDIGDAEPEFFKEFIRVLCNANVTEGFQPKRDAALPEVYLPKGKLGPPHLGQDPNKRSILAFFSGGAHGDIRKILLNHWKEKDNEVQVYQYLPKGQNYNLKMGQSKFCLCPSGFEVASPRIVEAIYAGCVPVLISSNYSLPFRDVLDWSQFSVEIPVENIPDIKKILQEISFDEYLKLQKNVMRVQRHFVLNRPAKPYDVIHMVLHSVWLKRLNIKLAS